MAQLTVLIKSTPEGSLQKEGISDCALLPGEMVEWSGDGTITTCAATIYASPKFVIEGGTVPATGTYASGDMVPFVVAQPGAELYAWLASGQNVGLNAVLEPDGNGELQEETPAAISVAAADVAATLTIGTEGTVAASGTQNAIKFTAVDAGHAGNGISVSCIDGTCDAGGISVLGENEIQVEIDGTTVASDLVTLLNANEHVAAMVTAATLTASSGTITAENDGTLSGGIDAGEITAGGANLQAALRGNAVARAMEAVNASAAIARIKVEVL